MNRGKIYKIKSNKDFKIKYGTIDNKEIKSVFINFTSWISIKGDEINYQQLINKLKKNIKIEIYKSLDYDIFSKKLIIVDLDIRESGLKNSLQTFMSLDISLYKNTTLTFKDKLLDDEINKLIKKINKVLKNYDVFDYHKIKRNK